MRIVQLLIWPILHGPSVPNIFLVWIMNKGDTNMLVPAHAIFGTYRSSADESVQTSAKTHQSLLCSHTQSIEVTKYRVLVQLSSLSFQNEMAGH